MELGMNRVWEDLEGVQAGDRNDQNLWCENFFLIKKIYQVCIYKKLVWIKQPATLPSSFGEV